MEPKASSIFTEAHHGSLFWARQIYSTYSYPIYLRLVSVLSFQLDVFFPSGPFLSGYPTNGKWGISLRLADTLCMYSAHF